MPLTAFAPIQVTRGVPNDQQLWPRPENSPRSSGRWRHVVGKAGARLFWFSQKPELKKLVEGRGGSETMTPKRGRLALGLIVVSVVVFIALNARTLWRRVTIKRSMLENIVEDHPTRGCTEGKRWRHLPGTTVLFPCGTGAQYYVETGMLASNYEFINPIPTARSGLATAIASGAKNSPWVEPQVEHKSSLR